jgi:hypothetical protein
VREGRSWRYDYYPQYKAKRKLLREMQTPKEKEEQEVFFDVLKDFTAFMAEETRCTVLQTPGRRSRRPHRPLHPASPQRRAHDPVRRLGHGSVGRAQRLDLQRRDQHAITHEGVFDERDRELVFSVKPGDGKLKIGQTLEEPRRRRRKPTRSPSRSPRRRTNRRRCKEAARKEYDRCSPREQRRRPSEAKTIWEQSRQGSSTRPR